MTFACSQTFPSSTHMKRSLEGSKEKEFAKVSSKASMRMYAMHPNRDEIPPHDLAA